MPLLIYYSPSASLHWIHGTIAQFNLSWRRSTPMNGRPQSEWPREIKWETKQSSTLHPARRRRCLHALQGIDGHGILHGPPGRYWSNRPHGFPSYQMWRSHRPSHSSEPIAPPPNLLHVVMQRKYAQRVDQGESDGQDQNAHGNDRHPID